MHAETVEEIATDQYLTFELAGEIYGVDILKVQEIKGWEPVRDVPNTPEFIRGMLNLRGIMVPVIDLHHRFSLEIVPYTPVTVVIILSVQRHEGDCVLGIVADAVSDVLDVKPVSIQPAPDFGPAIDTCYMKGMVAGDPMVMLLDVDSLLDPATFELMDNLN